MDSPVATATEGRRFQSVTRGGFGCRDGCATRIDLDGRKRASRCDESSPTQQTLERHEQIRWNRPWQQPRERQFQSVARCGLGRPGGHGTRIDLCNPKVAAHRGKLPRSQSADSAQAEGCTRTRVSPEVEASSGGFARGYCHRGAMDPKCDPRRLRPSGQV